MMRAPRFFLPSFWLALSPFALAAGCATQASDGLGGGGSTAETSASKTTSAGTTTSASTTTGGACAQDCSEIETPECYEAVCNEQTGTCDVRPMADGAGCEDGLFCTENDTCDRGLCQAGPPRVCDPGMEDCLTSTCDEDVDACVGSPVPNGTPCTNSDPCTVNAICQNGVCLGAPKDCSAAPVPDDCHVAVCDPMQNGMCVPVPGNDGQACTSGDPCMVQKTCDQGSCTGGTSKVCPSTGCYNGVCDSLTGNCTQVQVPPFSMCNAGTDACNIGICNFVGTCVPQPANDGGMCDDGNACTVNDVCDGGTCAGVPDPNYMVFFTETFASNAAGWTLGPEWAIGPAEASTCGGSPGNDPATDHTPSGDDGIAGVVIGGCYTTMLHGDYCLESPVIDASAAPASVYLSYWRHLHTDYPNYISSHVDVSSNGGTTWTPVYSVPAGQTQNDTAWTYASFDVTAQKSANMKVRFCYSAGPNTGIFVAGGWNVDDVTVANAPCP